MPDPDSVSELTALTTPAAADLLHIIDDVAGTPTDKKIVVSDLFVTNVKHYGAVPDDPGAGVANNLAFIAAISTGLEVLVDGIFTITPTADVALTESVILRGTNSGRIIFNAAVSNWFELGSIDRVDIFGVDFENISGSSVVIFKTLSTTLIDRFDIEKCTFDTNISLLRTKYLSTTDPTGFVYGIMYFTFHNNLLLDCDISFVKFQDMPTKMVTITNNRARNWSFMLFDSTITNGHTFTDEIFAHRRDCYVEGNMMINEDSHVATVGAGAYYLFILYEADGNFTYLNNHVEGMHATDIKAVYDIYVTTRGILTYEGNLWKNNICSNVNKTNAVLMKGKASVKRSYLGNTFIMEKAYVLSKGITQADGSAWVFMTELNVGQSIYIKNNVFEIFEMIMASSSQRWRNVVIEDNTFILNFYAGVLVAVNNDVAFEADYTDFSISICRNNFQIEEIAAVPAKSLTFGSIFRQAVDQPDTGQGTWKSLTINDNVINIANALSQFVFFGPENIDVTTVNFNRNTLHIEATDQTTHKMWPILYSTVTATCLNNHFHSPHSPSTDAYWPTRINGDILGVFSGRSYNIYKESVGLFITRPTALRTYKFQVSYSGLGFQDGAILKFSMDNTTIFYELAGDQSFAFGSTIIQAMDGKLVDDYTDLASTVECRLDHDTDDDRVQIRIRDSDFTAGTDLVVADWKLEIT